MGALYGSPATVHEMHKGPQLRRLTDTTVISQGAARGWSQLQGREFAKKCVGGYPGMGAPGFASGSHSLGTGEFISSLKQYRHVGHLPQ